MHRLYLKYFKKLTIKKVFDFDLNPRTNQQERVRKFYYLCPYSESVSSSSIKNRLSSICSTITEACKD